MISGPWVNPRHGRGQRDQVTALANRDNGANFMQTIGVEYNYMTRKELVDLSVTRRHFIRGNSYEEKSFSTLDTISEKYAGYYMFAYACY